MKNPLKPKRLFGTAVSSAHHVLVAWILAILVVPSMVWANPEGAQVVAGSATIQGGAGTMTITTSDRAIINWQGFSIGAGELTQFIQPGSSSAVLNRVVSGNPSEIMGSLQANGRVYLINPNGILVGGGATINTAAFIASTLDISNASFMNGGDLTFSGDSTATVRNLGLIKTSGGDVFLLAHHVVNEGTLQAADGVVGMAAGHEILLKQTGEERLTVRPAAAVTGTPEGVGIQQAGLIEAVQVELKATGSMYSLAINNGGVIRAAGVVNSNGRVILTAGGGNVTSSGSIQARNANGSGGTIKIDAGDSGNANRPAVVTVKGTLDASSLAGSTEVGGQVTITGNEIEITAAQIHADGDTGGGEVLIGGDFRGENPEVQNAWQTSVDAATIISADAREHGDGGKVVVWADDTIQFAGKINVRGGASDGDGGMVEVSGKETLQFSGLVNALAPKGRTGDLLLDPATISIDGGGTGAGAITGSTVLEKDLEAQMANVTLSATGTITVTDLNLNGGDGTITMANNVGLTIHAGSSGSGNLVFNNAANTISVSGTGNIFLEAGSTGSGTITNTCNLSSDTGEIRLFGADGITFGGTITTAGGDVRIWGDSDDAGGGGLTIGSTINIGGAGNLLISAGSSAINLNGPITLSTGAITFKADGNFTTGTRILANQITATGNFSVNSPFQFNSGAGISTTGSITFSNTLTMNTGTGALTLRGSSMDFSGATISGQGTSSIVMETVNAGDNIDVGGTGFASAATLTKLSGFKNVTFGRTDSTGTVTVSANSSIANSGTFRLIGDTIDLTPASLANTTGNIQLTGNNINITQAVTATGGAGTVTLEQRTASNALTLGTGLPNSAIGQISAATLIVGRSDGGALTVASDITTTAANVHLKSGSTVTATAGGIAVANLAVTAGGAVNLTDSDFSYTALAVSAAGQTVTVNKASGVNIGTVDAVVGVTCATLNITTSGAITDASASVVTGTTTLNAGAGNNITLDVAANNFGTVAITSGNNVTLRDTNGLIMGASTVTGTLDLTSGAAITQSGAITTGTLVVSSTGATTLSDSGNAVGTLGAVTAGGNFSLNDSTGGLILNGAVAVGANNATIQTTGGNLTINAGGSVSNTGAANVITLVTDQNFINNVGAGILTAAGGAKYLVYSTAPGSNVGGFATLGASYEQFNTTYPGAALGVSHGFLYIGASPPATTTTTSTSTTATIASSKAFAQGDYDAFSRYDNIYNKPQPMGLDTPMSYNYDGSVGGGSYRAEGLQGLLGNGSFGLANADGLQSIHHSSYELYSTPDNEVLNKRRGARR